MTPTTRLASASISLELSRRIHRMRQPLEEGTRYLRSSSLLHGMRLNSLRTKECNSSKSANCRIGSTRNEKIYAYFNKPSSMSTRHMHTVEELERELMTSIIASSRIRQSSPRFLVEPARTLSQPSCSFVTCPRHRTLRPIGPVMKSEDSSRPLPCSRPRVPPRGDVGLPRSSLWSPPDTRERGLGSSRACPAEQGSLCP
jgi:hypothetical protein